MSDKSPQDLDRRAFLGVAGAAASFMIVKPQQVRGSQANSAVSVGLLGCGGRGTADATSIATSGPARINALGDLFEDRLNTAKDHFDSLASKQQHAGVSKSQLFHGPHAAQQIFASREIDAVVIATPPYFHPEHLAAAVEAHKHVYCEKPVGVDVPGAMRAIETGKKAEGRVSLDVGFQIRKAPPFVELVKRIHAGALGEITCGEAHYYCNFITMPEYPGVAPDVLRLRHWLHDRVLSGDIIVEQNIHAIDICNWVLQGHPVKAIGTGGRKGRTEQPGNAWSHFDVVFYYPNDVQLSFSSTQFGKGGFDVSERFFGTRGSSQSPYSGPLLIAGDEPWTWGGGDNKQPQKSGDFSITGSFSDNLAQADSEKHADFINSIVTGSFHNQAAMGAESALTAMLGRTAAYSGKETTWDEMLRANEAWHADIDIEKMG
jgi:myo-inositol 2-dehydrogenase / D-chiro-inositol 1-dehydrogenase